MFSWATMFALWVVSSVSLAPSRLARVPGRTWGWVAFWVILLAVAAWAIFWGGP
jgi:hypothetical protein